MGQSEEPRMDELKKLLRRLDGLDSSKSVVAKGREEKEERGYVGALRGMPVVPGEAPPSRAPAPDEKKGAGSGVYVAAATAAVISALTVYLVLSSQGIPGERGVTGSQPSGPVPTKLDYAPRSGGALSAAETALPPDDLVRRADLLIAEGETVAARVLLRQAAEQGSGAAALKLGRTYDPAQPAAPGSAPAQANPELAKAWYQRALALGTPEAAGYIAGTGGR